MRPPRLRPTVCAFLDAIARNVAPATLRLYKHYLTAFIGHVGDIRLDRLSPAIVLRWNAKYHPAGVVRRLCRWATVEARLIPVNPLDGMKTRRQGSRGRVLDRAEVVRLLRFAAPAFRRLLVALVESIARPREMRAVKWGDIWRSGSPRWTPAELAGGRCYFRLVAFKGQTLRRDRLAVRNIPISRRLARMLLRFEISKRNAAYPIFVNSAGRPWTHNAVRCAFRRLRVRAEVAADANGENAVAYSLRHTAATAAIAAGVKGLVLAELMGHSDVRMTQRYVHLRPDHLIEAMGRIEGAKTHFAGKSDRLESLRNRPDGVG